MAQQITLLDESLNFPPVDQAIDGLLAVGGDLSPARLLAAYENGIFPWYDEDTPPLWWAPENRAILELEDLKVSKSMRSVMRNAGFTFTMDRNFPEVIQMCKETREQSGDGSWIVQETIDGYCELHALGMAHSVETWRNGKLVGGLYGVSIGRMFFGESMFSIEKNASKAAFIRLVGWLASNGFGPIDCQIQNDHLASLGVKNVSRTTFERLLVKHLNAGPTLRGSWSFDSEPPDDSPAT
ncbi:MAG: leucyl/phenylalanyl-tRNA--protein transferase [Flavobacteriales bacterium]